LRDPLKPSGRVNRQPRGRHLVYADRGFATGGGLLGRPWSGGFQRILDRIDAGLVEGGIDARFRTDRIACSAGESPADASGPSAQLARARAVDQLGLGRLVQGMGDGRMVQPDPVPLFDLFMRNGGSLVRSRAPRGVWRAANRLAHLLRAQQGPRTSEHRDSLRPRQ
jgi:cyclopropane-fatty-acyl-phospholipid synthase